MCSAGGLGTGVGMGVCEPQAWGPRGVRSDLRTTFLDTAHSASSLSFSQPSLVLQGRSVG